MTHCRMPLTGLPSRDRASAWTLLQLRAAHATKASPTGLRPAQRIGATDMAASPWYVEIVRVSSHERQQDLLTLLRDVAGVTALGSSSGSDHFVIFECPDLRLKIAIDKLFVEVDPASVLTHTARKPLQPEGGGIA